MEIVAVPGPDVGGGSIDPLSTAADAPDAAWRRRLSERPWREELRLAVRDAAQLLAAVELTPDRLSPGVHAGFESTAGLEAGAKRLAGSRPASPGLSDGIRSVPATPFPLFAPWPFIARMAKGDPHDPLLRQVLPLADEALDAPGFTADPVGDALAMQSPGLLQKYDRRALFITTGACAIHCRYCFRREYPYSESPRSPDDWQPAIDRLAADPTIDEAILSGGDPLTIVDQQLAELARRLARVPHLKRLRVHTRLPIVIPQRVTSELIDWLRGTRLAPIMVVHANHPHEIDEPTAAALSRLVDAGIPVLNQAVLLAGVNDNAQALIGLSRRLVDLRVMPYYLHQLDRVRGAAHFEVPVSRGRELIAAMRRALPGYAVPRYVQEVAGEPHKRVLA